MNQKRILIISTSYAPLIGGSELAIESIAKELHDFQFDIVTSRARADLPPRETNGNVRIFRVGGGLFLKKLFLPKLFLPLALFYKARQLHKKNKYAAVHAYQASQAGGAAWLLKIFFPKLPFILTLQEGKDLDQQAFPLRFTRKIIIRRADWVTAISNYLKDFVGRIKPKVAISVIPNGVDIHTFSQTVSSIQKEKIRAKYNITPNQKIIISASRLVPKNGSMQLLEAFAKLLPSHDVVLFLAGTGDLMMDLKRRSAELNVSDRVILAGDLSHSQLAQVFKSSEVFVRPSKSEGLGNAFLEAMAAELPVIGSAVGGIPDFLRDGQTGLFCDPASSSDIAEKIKKILDDPNLASNLKKNGREVVLNRYSWPIVAQQMRKVYNHFI